MLCGLIGASELLCLENSQSELAKMIYQSSLRLKKEVEIQRCLSQSETYTYNPSRNKITTGQIQKELRSSFLSTTLRPETKIYNSRYQTLPCL